MIDELAIEDLEDLRNEAAEEFLADQRTDNDDVQLVDGLAAINMEIRDD